MRKIKKLVYFMLLLTIFCTYPVSSINAKPTKDNSSTEPNKNIRNLKDDAMLSLLYPYIANAIDNYPGIPKQFDIFWGKILSIERPSEAFEFIIVVQVETFTGAHNPPGGIETLTIRTSPVKTEVIKFEHKEIS